MRTTPAAPSCPGAWRAARIVIDTGLHLGLRPPPGTVDGDPDVWTFPAAQESLQRISELRVEPDNAAVVVIDEASGTIVMGANVRISTVAIAQGNLTIRVTETPQVSQPGPLSNGTTTVVPRTNIQVDDGGDKKLGVLSGNVTLRDLVTSLNALGVGPRDMITILQAIKAAGALQADLVVR